MRFDFDAAIDRSGTWSTRWDRYGAEVIPLWVADTDFRAPPDVLEALAGRAAHGVIGYTTPPAALREALVERMRRLYGWSIEPSWIVFLPAVVPGLHIAARRLAPAQAHAVLPTPVYQHFKRALELASRAFTEVPLVLERGRWVWNLDRLRAAVGSETALFFLCNPQNPGGTSFTRDELARLAELSGNCVIVSDEIHCDLILEPGTRHVPIASLGREVSRRTVTLGALTKAFNFPGAPCAWAIAEDERLRSLMAADVQAHVLSSPSVFGYAATLAACAGGADWLAAQIEYLRGNRELVERAVAAMNGLKMAHVEATYLAWIDCSGAGLEDPYQHFLRAGVALSPGAQFGDSRFVRLNFGTQRARLAQALERMSASLRNASRPSPRG